MVDADLIRRKLLLLKDKKQVLEKFPQKDFQAFRLDVMLQKAVEKILEEMVQICIDVGKHIVADENLPLPDNNAGVFDVLRDSKVISNKTASLMKKMVGFRNIMVHMYEKIDVESVYINYRKKLSDFDDYAGEIDSYLGNK